MLHLQWELESEKLTDVEFRQIDCRTAELLTFPGFLKFGSDSRTITSLATNYTLTAEEYKCFLSIGIFAFYNILSTERLKCWLLHTEYVCNFKYMA
jgi:hypothetical protein